MLWTCTKEKKNAKLKTIKDFLKQKHNCFFKKKNTHISTRVTLNSQTTLYLYIVSRVAKRMHVVCETFARKHKSLIIDT